MQFFQAAYLYFLLQLEALLVQSIIGSTALCSELVVFQPQLCQLLLQQSLLLLEALLVLTPGC